MKIEFILAMDNGLWEAKVLEVPDEVTENIPSADPHWDAAIVAWCHDELAQQTQYRSVVYWGIYNSQVPDGRFKVVWTCGTETGTLPETWDMHQEAMDAGERWRNEKVRKSKNPMAAVNECAFEVLSNE